MKFWAALAALTLLAGCGAELSDDPSPTLPSPTLPSPTLPSPTWRVWGLLEFLGDAAENATEKIRASALVQKIESAVRELRDFGTEARHRLVAYGEETRALLELSVSDLRARGSAFARKFRKRLSRDQEELKKRWDGGRERIREIWGSPERARDGGD